MFAGGLWGLLADSEMEQPRNAPRCWLAEQPASGAVRWGAVGSSEQGPPSGL